MLRLPRAHRESFTRMPKSTTSPKAPEAQALRPEVLSADRTRWQLCYSMSPGATSSSVTTHWSVSLSGRISTSHGPVWTQRGASPESLPGTGSQRKADRQPRPVLTPGLVKCVFIRAVQQASGWHLGTTGLTVPYFPLRRHGDEGTC